MDRLVELMKNLLADTFALYLKAQYYHWNVEGPNFKQYHDFFGDFYESVYANVDSLAEQIRALDSYAPGSLERFVELKSISGEDQVITAKEMLVSLKADNEKYLSLLDQTNTAAEAAGKKALANYLQGVIDSHSKHRWMLKSITKE